LRISFSFTQPTSSFLLAVTRRATLYAGRSFPLAFQQKEIPLNKITSSCLSPVDRRHNSGSGAANDGLGGGHKISMFYDQRGRIAALDVGATSKATPTRPAELSAHGITYSNAGRLQTRIPFRVSCFSDRWLTSQPRLFYDVSYNRGIFDPTNTTCWATG